MTQHEFPNRKHKGLRTAKTIPIIQRTPPLPDIELTEIICACTRCNSWPSDLYTCTCCRLPWCSTCGCLHIRSIRAAATKRARSNQHS
jgi:hypothetical protein